MANDYDAAIHGPPRRRAAMRSSSNIPFEQLPYQCFQEARKVLLADREEKLVQIAKERNRIENLRQRDVSSISGGERTRQTQLYSMQKHLEWLKIQADINDPLIKKRFEDGDGTSRIHCLPPCSHGDAFCAKMVV